MEHITLDHKVWRAGISSLDGVEDGGYSPKYGGHVIHYERDDLLYPQPAIPDFNEYTDMTGIPVLWVKSPGFGLAFGSAIGAVVDDDNKVYSLDAVNDVDLEGTLTNVGTSVNNEEHGTSFQGDIYIGMDNDVVRIPVVNGVLGTIDDDWWTNTRGHGSVKGQRNNLVVVEDTLYIIADNEIHIWDGSTSQEDALILPPDFMATAAIKHPNGRDLIVFGAVRDDASENAATEFRVYYINTVDLEFTDELVIDSECTAAWNVGGTIFVVTKQWLGIFDGTGKIDKIYRLEITLNPDANDETREDEIWTNHGCITHQGWLLVPDGSRVLAVGDFGNGTVLWHPLDLSDEMDVIHQIWNFGNYEIGVVGYEGALRTGTLKTCYAELEQHDGAGKWASNKLRFNQKVWVRKIALEFETLESGDDFSVGHIMQDGTEQTLAQITYATYGAVSSLDIYPNVHTDVFQYLHTWTTGGVGLKKVTIFYENGE